MKVAAFPDWQHVLDSSELPSKSRQSFAITIRWYLSFCRRARVEVTVQSARDFIDSVTQQRHPQAWQLEDWKEGLRWFFRTAKEQTAREKLPEETAAPAIWIPPQSAHWPEWKVAFLTAVRRRRYSYRTEESYLVWLERFARYLGTDDLRAQGEAQIQDFLNSLALNTREISIKFAIRWWAAGALLLPLRSASKSM
jgi:hypothetical protein